MNDFRATVKRCERLKNKTGSACAAFAKLPSIYNQNKRADRQNARKQLQGAIHNSARCSS
eukprot:IDg9632t1